MSDSKDNATPGDPSFLTVDQAAAILKVDRKTVYGAIKAGQIPGVLRLGRTYRINRAALCGV